MNRLNKPSSLKPMLIKYGGRLSLYAKSLPCRAGANNAEPTGVLTFCDLATLFVKKKGT